MDQKRVGRVGWVVLHCAAEAATRTHSTHHARQRLTALVKCMGEVFPCKKCRDDIWCTWQIVGRGRAGEDVKLSVARFHAAVTAKVAAQNGKPFCAMEPEKALKMYGRRYERLVDGGAWIAYAISFMYSVAMNCAGIADNIGKTHEIGVVALHCRLRHFMLALQACTMSIGIEKVQEQVPEKGACCTTIHSAWWKWEEALLGGRHVFESWDRTRATHLCTRVRSKFFDPEKPLAHFCSSTRCMGACSQCDRALLKGNALKDFSIQAK